MKMPLDIRKILQDKQSMSWLTCLNAIGSVQSHEWARRFDLEYKSTFIPVPEGTRFVMHTIRSGSFGVVSGNDLAALQGNLFTANLEQQTYGNTDAEKTVKRLINAFISVFGIMDMQVHVIKRPLRSTGEVLLSAAVISKGEIIPRRD
tara:strand:- start:100815 stop:101258 length:444 start_codon:yes stop_codon:yes gene_type:complete